LSTVNPPRIVIFGATSAIAEAVARCYAAEGGEFFLAARDGARLDRVAADLEARGAAAVAVATADLADPNAHDELVAAARAALAEPDAVLLAWGTLTDQAEAEGAPDYVVTELTTNFTAPAALALRVAAWLEPQRRGVVAVISSVAGDRGRQSNFVYGSAKGGLQRFLEGLRHRLHRHGVAVLDVRPGFVATPMTAHLDRSGPLWASPERIAADIVRAIARRRAVLYTPWFWRWIMLIIRCVPRAVFHRTRL
jgi:decaprenylphospho-beta-D-erythro-pentofuranosid-2-ulose 2-reductase